MPADQKGFAPVLIPVLIVLIVAVLGGGYWINSQGKMKQPQVINQPEVNQPVIKDKKDDAANKMAAKSTFTTVGSPKLIFSGGYADPTLSTLPDGKRIMYLNNFSKQPATYEAHTSTDGINWTKVNAKLPNTSTGRAVKFGALTRLYYPDLAPIRPSDPPASVLSASSGDGLNFTKESGTRIDPKNGYYLEGPTVFALKDNSYRMFFSENETASAEKRISKIWGASSADGLSWTRDDKATIDPIKVNPWPQALHPFVLVKPDGSYIMFYNTHSEVYAAKSTDGKNWTEIGKIGIHGADVDGYYQDDGTIRLFYGDFSEQTSGVVYTAVIKEN